MPSFSFILTEECDWKCEYCYFTHIKQKEPKLEIFQKHLPYIKKIIDKLGDLVVNIDVQGGEIGTIPIEILEYFCETIDNKIAFSTNGLFLNKKIHLNEKIKPYIGLIMWHVHDLKSGIFRVEDYLIQDIPISRGIVHSDVDEIIEFIKMNPSMTFDYIEFEFNIRTENKMNVLMYHDLLNKLEGMDNVTDNAREILQRRLSEYENHRDNCMKYNHSILIDMVNENICLCQRQPDVSIELNRANLVKRLHSFPKDIFRRTNCNSCTRLYAGKFYGNVIERALQTRNVKNL